MSLQVGTQVCTLSEHPVDHLLMFTEITPHPEALMAEQNLHCQDLCKPVIGRDPQSQAYILWNRQSLMQMDQAQVLHQFSLLVAAAQTLSNLHN
ncbi:CesT family type III secretion system chaperone [Pseudomonas entomophila]|nr:CesT family type III secretion system chaperone [Pseudomonas entomophila]